MVELKEGVIRAAIHVHMNPAEAAYYGVKHKDLMKLRVGGDAALTFIACTVRVDPAIAPQRPHGYRRGQRLRPAPDEGHRADNK